MLTIRRSQLTALGDQALVAFRMELARLMRERSHEVCARLGPAAVDKLIELCITTCRDHGATGRAAIATSVESLFATEGVESMSSRDVARVVGGELDGRRLYSLLETLAGVEET